MYQSGIVLTSILAIFLAHVTYGEQVTYGHYSGVVSVGHRAQGNSLSSCHRGASDSAYPQKYVTLRLSKVTAYVKTSRVLFGQKSRYVVANIQPIPTLGDAQLASITKLTGRNQTIVDVPHPNIDLRLIPVTQSPHLTIKVTLHSRKSSEINEFDRIIREIAVKTVTPIMPIGSSSVEASFLLLDAFAVALESEDKVEHLLDATVKPVLQEDGTLCVGFHAVFGASDQDALSDYVKSEALWDSDMNDLYRCNGDCEKIDGATYAVVHIATSEWYYPDVRDALSGPQPWAKLYRRAISRGNSLANWRGEKDELAYRRGKIDGNLEDAFEQLMEDDSILGAEQYRINNYARMLVKNWIERALDHVEK